MTKRPPKAPGMPWLSPYLAVKDANKSLDFYQRAFGFEKKEAMAGPDGKIKHGEVVWRDAVVMFGPEGTYDGREVLSPATRGTTPPVQLYVYVDDVDAFYTRATKAGATSIKAPETMFWGDRSCTLADPDGHLWSFATNVADFDPSKAPC